MINDLKLLTLNNRPIRNRWWIDRSPALPRYAFSAGKHTADRVATAEHRRVGHHEAVTGASASGRLALLALACPPPLSVPRCCPTPFPFLFRDLVPFSSVPDSPLREVPFEVPIARFGCPAVPGIICPKSQPRSDAPLCDAFIDDQGMDYACHMILNDRVNYKAGSQTSH
ncbi:hypothetical protein OPV22_008403 [Ensete ventricosum]|uniref:Uncharacterized protein n=1 Tax=Ensete ventricosum TaxID=4639 RepID=A0AAV8R6I5_ENSVE|nr:hypothetical protein OPV22_008403 [Ensete ventricosum]